MTKGTDFDVQRAKGKAVMITELKLLGVCWISSVLAIPVVGQIGSAEAGEKLATGNVQMVLAVVVLALSGGIMWVTKRLLKSMEDRIAEAKKVREDLQSVLTENSAATTANALAAQQLKDSVYHLAKCIDKCPGPSPSEVVTTPPPPA
jgi:uncharacterized membrane protein